MNTKSNDKVVNLINHLRSFLDSELIFAKPISVEGQTIIPVAQMSFGFGAGLVDNERNDKKGIGFGMHAKPIGYILMTKDKVVFVPIKSVRRLSYTVFMLSLSSYVLMKAIKLFL